MLRAVGLPFVDQVPHGGHVVGVHQDRGPLARVAGAVVVARPDRKMYAWPVAGSILRLLRVLSQKTSYMQLLIAVGNVWLGMTVEGNDTTATALAVIALGVLGGETGEEQDDRAPLLPGDFRMTTRTAAASPFTHGVLVLDCIPAGVPVMFQYPMVTTPLSRATWVTLLNLTALAAESCPRVQLGRAS